MKSVSSEFNTAFADDVMEVKARVLMEFGNNRYNASLSTYDPEDPASTDYQVCTASSTKVINRGIEFSLQTPTSTFWSSYDIFNNLNRNSMRWAVLDRGAEVKSSDSLECYRAIDINENYDIGSPAYERGWWSSNKSNGAGTFSSPEWVMSTWDDDRKINQITLYTMEGYSNMKSVTVQYRSGVTWNTVATYTLGASEYIKTWTFSEVSCTGLRVYFNSTYDVSDYARCNELQGYYNIDISDQIINCEVDQEKEEFETTVPVGIVRANTSSLVVDNIDQAYSQNNAASPYYPYVSALNRFTVEFGIKKEDTTFEYTPMGEFWVDEWQISGDGLTASASSRDFSRFLQDENIHNVGKTWTNTTITPVIRDILARAGKCQDEITINPTSERVYEMIFIKDKTFWAFLSELSLADQGLFGFDESGYFTYETYSSIDDAPNDVPQYILNEDTNIISGSEATSIYVNSVIVKLSPYRTLGLADTVLWEATPADALDIMNPTTQAAIQSSAVEASQGSDVVLGWNFLSAGINSTVTTISVTLNNTTQNFDANYGYLLIGDELIHYQDRTDSTFTNCTRGYGNTVAASHTSGDLIGRAKYWEMQWSNAPAVTVKYPFCTAINELLKEADEGEAQAKIILFSSNAFGGRLAIGNIVPYYTILKGKGRSKKIDDPELEWSTVIAGKAILQKGEAPEIGARTGQLQAENRNIAYIRRYGKNEITIDNPWIQSIKHAQEIRAIYFDEYRYPRQILDMETLMNPAVQLNDRVQISSYSELEIVDTEYNLISLRYAYDGGLRCTAQLRQVKR